MSEVIYSLSETINHKFWSIYPSETQNCELAVLTAFTLLKSMNFTGFKPPTL
jgi:N-acetyl-beta-hexosaminidase